MTFIIGLNKPNAGRRRMQEGEGVLLVAVVTNILSNLRVGIQLIYKMLCTSTFTACVV